METVIFENAAVLAQKTADFIQNLLKEKPDALLCFPAGHTSVETFKYLAGYQAAGGLDFTKCRFVGLDDWAGLDPDEKGCREFMYEHLFVPLKIRESQIVFFDGRANDLNGECKRMDEYILKEGPIDLMLLGIGMNGHLGLNEPGTPFDLYSHVVELDTVTGSVGQKYFTRAVKLEKGITLGLRHVMESGIVILQVSGSHKTAIIERMLKEEISPLIPASILRMHARSYLYADRDAAKA